MDKNLEFSASDRNQERQQLRIDSNELNSLENQDEIPGSSRNLSETMTTENVLTAVFKEKSTETETTGSIKLEDSKISYIKDIEIINEVEDESLIQVDSEVTGVDFSTLVASGSSDSVDGEEGQFEEVNAGGDDSAQITITLNADNSSEVEIIFSTASDQELPATNENESISIEEIEKPAEVIKESGPIPRATGAQPVDRSRQRPFLLSDGMCIRTVPSVLGNISLYVSKDSSYDEKEFKDESLTERIEAVLEMIFPFEFHLNKFITFSKAAYRFVRRGTYIFITSFCILVLPIVVFGEMAALEESKKTKANRALYGADYF